MANAMIDLGEVPRHREHAVPASAVRAPVPYRALLGALSILLIALLAGAAHRGPPWAPAIIAGRLSDVAFVDDGRLVVVSVGPELLGTGMLSKIISRYTLPDAKLLSRTTVAVSGSVSTVLTAGDTILVSYQVDATGGQATVALAEGTATVLWRQPVGLLAVSAAAGVALVTAADNGSAWSVVDLETGEPRWSLPQSAGETAGGFGYVDGFPRWFVTTAAGGHVAARDALTGAVTATATVPGFDAHVVATVWVVGDLLMVVTARGGLSAYALPGLVPRWQSDVDLSQSWTQAGCGPVICAFRPQHGMTAFDPATGRLLWDSDRWAYAELAGRYLVATVGDQPTEQTASQPQLWLLDPATGRVLGNFGPWQGLATDGEDRLTYAMYQQPGDNVVWYGVLDPDRLDVRILGSADRVSGSCFASTGALICRLVDASVGVWQLR